MCSGSVCSSTSGAGTPCSERLEHADLDSSSASDRHQQEYLLNSALDRVTNLSMDSVHEDSVDDILDGVHSGDASLSNKRRNDSLHRQSGGGGGGCGGGGGGCLDDLDLDMDIDQDQVDNCCTTTTTTTASMSGAGSVSARGCLETQTRGPSSLGCVAPYPLLQDELTSLDRIIRTSSVGSKPELIRRKNRSVSLPS